MGEITGVVIIEMVTAIAGAIAAGFKWALTPQGQRFSQKMMDDDEARQRALGKAGKWIADLFSGKLFANALPPK